MRLSRHSFALLFIFSVSGWTSSWAQSVAKKVQSPTTKSKSTTRLVASASAGFPNVIVITLDTTRSDRMGFLGSERGLTPNLDFLAKDGAVFTRAFSHVPLTPPSHATILTGTYPEYNHVDDFGA